jgi:hypothetical protein
MVCETGKFIGYSIENPARHLCALNSVRTGDSNGIKMKTVRLILPGLFLSACFCYRCGPAGAPKMIRLSKNTRGTIRK